jgi:hypothetical protein
MKFKTWRRRPCMAKFSRGFATPAVTSCSTLATMDALGVRAKPWREDLLHLPEKAPVEQKLKEYVVRLLTNIRAKL